MRIVLLATLMLFSASLFANIGKSILRVELKDGTKNEYILEERPQIKFAGEKAVFYCNDVVTEYFKDNIERFAFICDETGISELNAGDTRISYIGDKVLLEGVSESNNISVYSLDGKKQQITISKVGQIIEMSLLNLSKGSYIISLSNKQSFKVLKK